MCVNLLNRVAGTRRSNLGVSPSSHLRRFGRGVTVLVALAFVLSWSTASADTKPPPKKRLPKAKQAIQRLQAPPQAQKEAAKPVKSPSRAKEPVAIPGSSKQYPVIKCQDPVRDFGTLWVGPVLEHTYTIENAGKAPLKIMKVKPSCGCTIAGPYPKTIEPGQSGTFPFSVASHKLRGKFEKAITIKSNDPVTPNFRLRLRGEVKRYVQLTPTAINFGTLYGSEPMEKVIKINNNTDDPITVELGTGLDPPFKAEVVASEPGRAYQLRVRAEPPYKPGVQRQILLLRTSNDNQRRISVNVRASVPKRLNVSPGVLTVIPRKSETELPAVGLMRVVRFNNYGATPVKILEAKVNDPAVKVNLNEQTEGKSYSVEVEFPPDYSPPLGGRMLTLKTNDPDTPNLQVPIRGKTKRPKTADRKKRPAEGMVGKAVPNFALTTVDGKSITSKDLKGKVTVLDFFAVNCPHCKKQIARLETIRKQYADKGVEFVTVSQTMRNKKYTQEQTIDKIKEAGFRGQLAYDPDNKVGPKFTATSFPTMVVVGKTGRIGAVNIGNMGDLEKRLTGQLDALIAGRPVPKVADAKPTPQKRERADALVGKPAPKFAIKTLEGKDVSNATLTQAPVTVLNFVAPNCGHCKRQIPRVEKLRQKYTEKGVRFVNIAGTMGKKYETEEVVKIMKDAGSNLELAHDADNKVAPLFNARGFPTMVVIGKDGKVAAANIGNIGDLEKRLETQLDAVIAGKPVPKSAASAPAKKPRKRPAESLAGKPAPAFKVTTLAGKTLSNDDFKNHPATVLNFVAPDCGFCKRQLPNVDAVRKAYEAKGVRFVNVVQKMRKDFTEAEITDIMVKAGSGLELSISDFGDNKAGQQFKASGFPTMYVVDKQGKVAHVNVGAKQNLEALLKGQLDGLIKGKPAAPGS